MDVSPPFKLGASQYDQSTFSGRLRHLLDITDPRALFTSSKRLQECVDLLDAFKNNQLPEVVTNKDLWAAQKVKQILMPFRMSGYVPFGTVTVVGMMLPNPTFKQMIFWQWMNQSHNACVNYSNRNATKPTPTSRFVIGYIGAVTSAISIAVGLSKLIKKANAFSPAAKMLIQRFVPFPAVASANVCNVFLMRNNELTEGIEVLDQNRNTVGTSKIAARKAVVSTAGTRVFLPAPLLIIPPIIMNALEKTNFLRCNPRFHLPINAVVCTICFGLALPVAIALFPQYASIKTKDLEPEIQKATNEEVLIYNKGL